MPDFGSSNGRRNRIQQIAERKEIEDGRWPVILESLVPNPTEVFMVMTYVPFPVRVGKRAKKFQAESNRVGFTARAKSV